MIDRTNAERQARYRAKRDKELAELRALRNKKPTDAGIRFPSERVEDIAQMLFATYPGERGKRIASLWLELIARKAVAGPITDKAVAGPIIEWCTLSRARQLAQSRITVLPGGATWWLAQAKWLRGHENSVIEITVAPIASSSPLAAAEKILAALPGVYRIARFDREGRFGREHGEQRKQVRALMAVTTHALQNQPLGRGGWSTPGAVVVYDPHKVAKEETVT